MSQLEGPTPRQLDVLRAISACLEERGFPPTVRELCEALDVASTNTVTDHLELLLKKGLVERERYTSRGLRLTHRALAFIGGRAA